MKQIIVLFMIIVSNLMLAQTPVNSLKFDGTDDRITMALPAVFNSISTSSITVEAWVKPTGSVFSRILFAQLNPTNFLSLTLSATNTIYVYVNNVVGVTTTNSIPLNQWSHVAATWNGSTSQVDIYINGVLQTTASGGSSSTGLDNVMNIGSRTNGAQYFNGELDELRIWDDIRTSCEINASMTTEFTTSQPNLVAYYKFNEGVAAATNTGVISLPDFTTNYNGTLQNFALTGINSNWLASGANITNLNNNSSALYSVDTKTACNSYTWIDGNTYTSSNNTVTYTRSGVAIYGCDSIIQLNLTINTASLAVNSSSICNGQSSIITATGVGNYLWSTGAVTSSITVSPSTNTAYTCTLTSAEGCTTTATSTVTVNPLPVISVNSGAICSGQSFTMVPTGATTYTYSNGTDVVMPTANATYSVSGTDANGCVSSVDAVSSVTVNALPTISAVTNNTLLCVGQTATLSVSGATTYTWNTTENTASIAVSPTVQTTYTVNGTDANGCSNNTTITQDVSACTGIATLSNDASINVYPNPNNGLFVVELTANSNIIVTNILGELIITKTFEAGKHNIDILNYISGVYFLKVIEKNKQQTIKIIKQ